MSSPMIEVTYANALYLSKVVSFKVEASADRTHFIVRAPDEDDVEPLHFTPEEGDTFESLIEFIKVTMEGKICQDHMETETHLRRRVEKLEDAIFRIQGSPIDVQVDDIK